MRKNSRKNKTGRLRRIAGESLVLSCTSKLSSRLISAFENGWASPLLASVEKTDSFVSNAAAPIEKKLSLRRGVLTPARNAAASFFAKNRLFSRLVSLKDRFSNLSLRSVGIFSLTFGVYSAAIFILRHYVSLTLGVGNPGELAFAAVAFLVGLFLLPFGEKSLLWALGTGRITGSLLSSCLGINESSLRSSEKGRGAVGAAFLLGSLCGIGTLFFSPVRILSAILCLILAISIFNVPEFGILLTIALLPYTPVSVLVPLVLVTLASYLFKCLRLKRNLRFGSADIAVLLLFAVYAVFAVSGSGKEEIPYLLCFVCIYFLIKNLICSERLIEQALNVLCLGVSVGLALWLLGEFAGYIYPLSLREAVAAVSKNVMADEALAILCVPAIPLAFSRIAAPNGKVRGAWTLALIIACTVVNDDPILYVLDIIAVLVYVAVAHKAPVGALLTAVAVLPAVLFVARHAFSKTSYSLSRFTLPLDGEASVMAKFGAVFAAVMFIIAVLLSFQRIFSCMRTYNSRYALKISGASASAAIMMIAVMLTSNPFTDMRSFAVMWFVLGLEGSIYGVYTHSQKNTSEVFG